jgi:glucose/arabinose dehydrogenase
MSPETGDARRAASVRSRKSRRRFRLNAHFDLAPRSSTPARVFCASILAFGLAGAAWAQATNPGPPAASDRLPPVPQTGAEVEAIKRKLAAIKLPEGFAIEFYASVPHARHIAVGPTGKVAFVGTREGKVFAVTLSPDSQARSVTEFAPSTAKTLPNGVCFGKNGALFVVELNRVLVYLDAERGFADPNATGKTIVEQGKLIPPAEEKRSHGARVCRVGPDGKLYIALGQPYNVPPPEKLRLYDTWGLGAIIRIGLDGSGRELFARGIRNSVGIDFNPKDKTLWFTDNQVDRMGDDIPPGELNRAAKPGLAFGFPWYGGGSIRTAEYSEDTPPAGLVFPQVETTAHAADLGLTFYSAAQFPEKYRGGIFSAQHGSWNRTEPVGARLLFTSLKPDGTADKTETFAEGWLQRDGAYWGRPVDVAPLPDGSILVSDDYAEVLYRISYSGRRAELGK